MNTRNYFPDLFHLTTYVARVATVIKITDVDFDFLFKLKKINMTDGSKIAYI